MGWRSWLAIAALLAVAVLFGFGRYTDFLNLDALQEAIRQFADGPWGLPAIILTFCASAFIGVPQFVLISIAVYGFGPIWGALFAWLSTLCSGALTYWIGRGFGKGVLARFTNKNVKRFTDFIARNALAASAIVRNVPTGPFLIVNMLFGAVGAGFFAYLIGMAIGIVPKILLIAFGMQAIQAAIGGQIWLAVSAALAALGVFVGGYLYVRYRRRKGENISFNRD